MKIVISGVNLVEAGPLKVFLDIIDAFSRQSTCSIICLVNDVDLFDHNLSNVEYISLPKAKKNWLNRLYYEYFHFNLLAKKIRPQIWLSMHDMTPRLDSRLGIRQYVYCHNAAVLYNPKFSDLYYEPKFYLFSKFYKYLYKINVSKNISVICQQHLLGDFLVNNVKAPSCIISKPSSIVVNKSLDFKRDSYELKSDFIIFYPALPRVFKNHELLFKAIHLLERENSKIKIKVLVTFDGSESRFSSYLYHKYSGLRSIEFLGKLDRKLVDYYYSKSDVVVFPSKLESLGLPIIEAKELCLPIILSDLPYAHETLGEYDRACFIDVNDAENLKVKLKLMMTGKLNFCKTKSNSDTNIILGWDKLVDKLILDANESLDK
ncbi:glycosyltransferase [Vibrio sp. SS-MA-C1-2]|uniref:glycosyltransferase n=1 Tax=Vibrio sp. SS-MA-C1-2 TaxID=2908646 RepID=UPI001F2FC717|nr:glycosyltransferase [Vibrio sp. SS-MA-C1-2]UJF18548.1 glycosyltransferase [Vibrio sp. SS-MA-C1-2]